MKPTDTGGDFKYLPAAVQKLSTEEKRSRLRRLAPHKAEAVETILDAVLDETWGRAFHGGPKGGRTFPEKGGA